MNLWIYYDIVVVILHNSSVVFLLFCYNKKFVKSEFGIAGRVASRLNILLFPLNIVLKKNLLKKWREVSTPI